MSQAKELLKKVLMTNIRIYESKSKDAQNKQKHYTIFYNAYDRYCTKPLDDLEEITVFLQSSFTEDSKWKQFGTQDVNSHRTLAYRLECRFKDPDWFTEICIPIMTTDKNSLLKHPFVMDDKGEDKMYEIISEFYRHEIPKGDEHQEIIDSHHRISFVTKEMALKYTLTHLLEFYNIYYIKK